MANVSTIKVTKVETFNAIAKALADNGITSLNIKGVEVNPQEFCSHEVELIQNKTSKKKRVDNSEWYSKVESALASGSKTPTELMALIGADNTQKVASVVKAMPNVERTVKGKKVTYSLK